jgi:hypothetical protein
MAIWAAGIGAAGSLLSGKMSQSGQSSANSMNQQMSLAQMMFQERMSRYAHRYEVQDLRKAGLNPILSGTGGAGSATPSGSTARMENEKGAGVSSALDALSTITQALLTSKQADKTRAETENTIANTATAKEQPGLVRASTNLANEQANTAKVTQRNIESDTSLKQIGAHVSMSELNKNNEMTNLLRKQGLTQDMQTKLLGVNVNQGIELLKGLRNDGAINETDYGKFLNLINRTLDTVNKIPIIGKGSSRDSRSYRDYRN